jgi:glycosyltransferase
MKISIITTSYNSQETIFETLKSVNSQSYNNIEHIIVDGESSDRTLEIVDRFDHVAQIISEHDSGVYEAMNKGIRASSGDIIGFLNSDDYFFSNDIMKEYADGFHSSSNKIIFGDLQFISRDNKRRIRSWVSSEFSNQKINFGWIPPHPTFYARRELFDNYGGFDESLRFAADYDLMIRFLKAFPENNQYLEGYKVNMRYGGETTKNLLNIYLGNKEILSSLKKNGYKVGPFFLLKKFIYKLLQFFIK